jgi:hypothetical protein
VTATLAPVVQWVTGSPLWPRAAAAGQQDGAAMRRPALLRFGSDAFMDDLAALLEASPDRLGEHLARPRSFRPPPPGAPAGWAPPPGRLKLYQPFHGDFNLVAASLVCRQAGLPDHSIQAAKAERVAFVLRRLEPVTGGVQAELAWAADPGGPGRRWQPLAPGQEGAIVAGEELFPMFPVTYRDGQQPRRLLVGVVPVASAETYRPSGPVAPFPPRPGTTGGPPGVPEADPRWDELDTRVIGPLAALRDPDLPPQVPVAQLEEASAMLLVDLAELLDQYLPKLWQALQPPSPAPPAEPAAAELFRLLENLADIDRELTWRDALVAAWGERLSIFGESQTPPTFRCNLARSTLEVRRSQTGDPPGTPTLQGRLRDALGAQPAGQGQGTPADPSVPKLEPTGEATYLVRCVYRRPQCAPFPTDLVSPPSEPFAIAPLLDPDAPARQIRIPLPVDTSVKDLRKFRKNVGFVLSNQLRSQMDRVTDLKKALDGELGEEVAWDLGVICQFSMPIITIVALVVLMLFLILLNIVFFWLPFFRICLPVPVRSRR